MPLDPCQPYPVFNPFAPYEVLDTPNNIVRQFGTYKFSFIPGEKPNYYTKKYNGDYQICVNDRVWNDFNIWDLFVQNIPQNNNQLIEKLLLIIEKLWMVQTEVCVFNCILNFDFYYPNTYNLMNTTGIKLNEVQTFLYYSWHRCHIEERIYPSVYGFNGRGDYLGATYILFANRYNLQPLNQSIQNQNYKDPQKVYKLANQPNTKDIKQQGFKDYQSLIMYKFQKHYEHIKFYL